MNSQIGSTQTDEGRYILFRSERCGERAIGRFDDLDAAENEAKVVLLDDPRQELRIADRAEMLSVFDEIILSIGDQS